HLVRADVAGDASPRRRPARRGRGALPAGPGHRGGGGSVNAPLLDRVLAICIAGDRGDAAGVDAAWDAIVRSHPDLLRLPLRHVLTAWVETEAGRLDGARRALAALDPADLDEL